jgi:hypothetical protein
VYEAFPIRKKLCTRCPSIEEPGEQSTIVFALTVAEPVIEYVCVCGGGGDRVAAPLAGFAVTNDAMSTRQCIVLQILHVCLKKIDVRYTIKGCVGL